MEIEIVNYIKEAKAHGLTETEIKQNLLDVGWDPGMVEDNFSYVRVAEPEAKPTPASQIAQPAAQSTLPHEQPHPTLQPILAKQASPLYKPLSQPAHLPPMFASSSGSKPEAALSFSNLPTEKTQTPAHETLSDQHFAASAHSSKKLIVILAIFVAVVVLGAGGYFAYGYFNPAPQKIWNKYATSKKNPITTQNFKFSYSDPGMPDDSGKPQPFSFSLSGSTYLDTTVTSSPVSKSAFAVGYQLPNNAGVNLQSGSRNFEVRTLNDILYLDLKDLPELSKEAGQTIGWLKFDLKELIKLASSTSYGVEFQKQLDEQKQSQAKIQQDLANIFKTKQIFSSVKNLGSETVSGVQTYHLQSEVDKSTLKTIINTVFDNAYASSSLAQAASAGAVRQVINNFIEKINIATFETWIGKKDSQIYKLAINVKMPGLATFADETTGDLGFLGNARAKSRDAKRLADTRQIATALELFYNDHNGYPAGQNGTPQGLTPSYIGQIPKAPTPADGACSNYYNDYWYTPTGNPKTTNGLIVYPSYEFTFCFGAETGGYKAGIAKLSTTGIEAGIACSDKPENCSKQVDVEQQQKTPQPLAEFNMQITYSDYGKKQEVTAPEDSLDVAEWIKQQFQLNSLTAKPTPSSLDSQRLSDTRQFAAGLELYYNDYGSYPKKIEDLSPKYLQQIPIAPTPAGGSCSETDNKYNYIYVSPESYKLSFCFGGATGGYPAGKHILSQAGIQ